ncbi:MAG: hypothetical protein GXY41_10990 [Phycisphaerae bacterium]|nr:hypothetical protein [Phycisphaerae bacterium]
MRPRDIKPFVRTFRQVRRYLKTPFTPATAFEAVQRRMENRPQNFLSVARELVYGHSKSPYRALLLNAGCDYADLEAGVKRHGIEATLQTLKDAGVYVSLEEFKCKVPICRDGLTIEPDEADFDNPLRRQVSLEASTSGSRSAGVKVAYNWEFLAEEAANELLFYDCHGLLGAPLAFWLPVLPCVSGIHNLLMNIKYHKIPDRWFSQLETHNKSVSRKDRAAVDALLWSCRLMGYGVPRPEFAGVDAAEKVARWMAATGKKKGPCMVRTYASSAVRLIQAAIEKGIDVSGNVVFTGAEPLTPQRAAFIQSAKVKALTRYVATETGLIGASCKEATACDDMHIYMDRLAIIQRQRESMIGGHQVDSYLFTAMLTTAGKVMFNTELGDFGRLTVRPCDCVFGRLGMNVHVSEVRSHDKLTCEGMTLLGSQLDAAVWAVVQAAGGGPEDYQFWETQDDSGLARLEIAVSPMLGPLVETQFIDAVLTQLRAENISLTSGVWQQAGTLRLVRAQPHYTRGCKKLSIVKRPV